MCVYHVCVRVCMCVCMHVCVLVHLYLCVIVYAGKEAVALYLDLIKQALAPCGG